MNDTTKGTALTMRDVKVGFFSLEMPKEQRTALTMRDVKSKEAEYIDFIKKELL